MEGESEMQGDIKCLNTLVWSSGKDAGDVKMQHIITAAPPLLGLLGQLQKAVCDCVLAIREREIGRQPTCACLKKFKAK